MDRSDVINLIAESFATDELMQQIPTETSRQVYCDVRSIMRSEWYEAGRDGLQPSFVFILFGPDYNGEKIVEYNGQRYGVYRTFRSKNDDIELYVEAKGGLHHG